MSPSFDGEQIVNILLDRIERNSDSAAKAYRQYREAKADADRYQRELFAAQAARNNYERDMKAAEAKVEEWIAYANKLEARFAPRRGQKLVLPKRPAPLETEIPF